MRAKPISITVRRSPIPVSGCLMSNKIILSHTNPTQKVFQIQSLANVLATQSTQKVSPTACFIVAYVFVTQCHTLFAVCEVQFKILVTVCGDQVATFAAV